MKRSLRWLLLTITVAVLAAGATLVSAIGSGSGGGAGGQANQGTTATARPNTAVRPGGADALPVLGAGTSALTDKIQALQEHLRTATMDAEGWATLGLYYVEQARTTVDPAYYAKAEAVLKTSLDLSPADNFIACAGQAALASGRHDFTDALRWAKRGLAINPYNAALYGTFGDALTQLGRYAEAEKAIQKMVDLRPGTPSFARASYLAELRGDLPRATSAMKAALDAAGTPSDVAFADYYLGELALNAGDAAAALRRFESGIAADPSYAALYEGRARAHAALGHADKAVKDFTDAVDRVPQPTYVLEYADYLTSLGRAADAGVQYKVFLAENALLQSNGVQLDTDATLYYADHGDVAKALQIGKAGIASRPFVEMHDAYAWALHADGQDAEALTYVRKALAPGMRNALFHFHHGMILKALGRDAQALDELEAALAINPHFSPLQAPLARAAVTELEAAHA
ncbi:MAG: hypothetical protein JWM93_2348 [Frankiales bacterium]|nr:hypothetical protein [Frankiales bacterium]